MTGADTTPQDVPDTVEGYQKELDYEKELAYAKTHENGTHTQVSCSPIGGTWTTHAIDTYGTEELATVNLGDHHTRENAAQAALAFMEDNPTGIATEAGNGAQ